MDKKPNIDFKYYVNRFVALLNKRITCHMRGSHQGNMNINYSLESSSDVCPYEDQAVPIFNFIFFCFLMNINTSLSDFKICLKFHFWCIHFDFDLAIFKQKIFLVLSNWLVLWRIVGVSVYRWKYGCADPELWLVRRFSCSNCKGNNHQLSRHN